MRRLRKAGDIMQLPDLISDNKGAFCFTCNIWGRRQKVKIMCGTESTVYEILPLVIENLDIIGRNKEKIGKMLFNGRYSDTFGYFDDVIGDSVDPGSELEHFLNGLYVSKVMVEVYKNNEFDVIFTVRSRKKYRLDFDDECVLYYDHSFEI